ncbi:MAG: DMT family transporter [Methanomicrobiales archaeon]|jgi:drug/metabolite transporter (DMT)-like permease
MLWAILAFVGAALDAGYYALAKRFLPSVANEVLAAGAFLATSALLFLISFAKGVPEISPALVQPVLVTGTINIIAAALVFITLRRTDLSLSVPLITFTLVFLMGTSYLVLGEIPTAAGMAGILLIVAGAFCIQLSPGRPGASPPRNGTRWEGIVTMLGVAFLYSLSLPYDKAVVLASDTVFGSALVNLYIGGVFAGIALARGSFRRVPRGAAVSAALALGLALAGETVAINLAYTLQIVPYVIAVKRLSILFSVLIGGFVFREEGIRYRILGALIMIAGVALIVLTTVPGSILS